MSVYDYLEFKHLKSIVAIADEGTITAAAMRIPLVQSALSRQISELEDALHIQIFERDRGGISPTPAGESLLNIKTKTGKTHEDLRKIADQKGLLKPEMKAGENVARSGPVNVQIVMENSTEEPNKAHGVSKAGVV